MGGRGWGETSMKDALSELLFFNGTLLQQNIKNKLPIASFSPLSRANVGDTLCGNLLGSVIA